MIELAITEHLIVDVTLQFDLATCRWHARTLHTMPGVRGNCIMARGNGVTHKEALIVLAEDFRREFLRKRIEP